MARKTLVSVWTHPNSDNWLVIRGRKKTTKELAENCMCCDDDHPSLKKQMKCKEEMWTDEKLNNLAEWES